jgi:hypothetical protein
MNIPADRPPEPVSIPLARSITRPNSPVSVINSSPRTSAGTGTTAVTGLTPAARIRRRSRAARRPVWKKSTWG